MKKLLCLPLLLCLCLPATAHEIEQPHVSVYGSAKELVVPDLMTWRLSLENKGVDLQSVSKAHTELTKELLQVIGSETFEVDKLKTTQMQFGENYSYRNNNRVRDGFRASTQISFELNNMSHYEAVWLALSNYPEVSVQSVDYDHSKREEIQQKVRIKALLAAREKAKQLAQTMGQTVTKALVISELGAESSRALHRAELSAFAAPEGGSSPVAPGTMVIEMKIKLIMGVE